MKLTGLVAQCVSNASFHILKKKRSRGWEIVVFIRINPKNAKIPILPNVTIKIKIIIIKIIIIIIMIWR